MEEKHKNKNRHKIALITGASSGIGESFARKLSSQGYGLILVARRKDRLEKLSSELRKTYSIPIDVLSTDLSKEKGVIEIEKRIAKVGNIAILVNNAGFGTRGHFVEVDIEKSVDMINVHIVASTRLTRAILPQMIKRNEGVIINVSTIVSETPGPSRVVYTATKSYLNSFSRSLQAEIREKGLAIKVRAILPGLTDTEFFSTEEYGYSGIGDDRQKYARLPEEVVEAALDSLAGDEVIAFPDEGNRELYYLMVDKGKTWKEAASTVFG
jgi:hypothetical protein